MLTAPLVAAIAALSGFTYSPCIIVDNPDCGTKIKYRAEYFKLDFGNIIIVDQMGRIIELNSGNWWIELDSALPKR